MDSARRQSGQRERDRRDENRLLKYKTQMKEREREREGDMRVSRVSLARDRLLPASPFPLSLFLSLVSFYVSCSHFLPQNIRYHIMSVVEIRMAETLRIGEQIAKRHASPYRKPPAAPSLDPVCLASFLRFTHTHTLSLSLLCLDLRSLTVS